MVFVAQRLFTLRIIGDVMLVTAQFFAAGEATLGGLRKHQLT